ncbi:MAG: ABC transporter substrate-binding protein [Firmicutes bacterium]|nr:ABC transporter substrate-binding protein [Bacillota bacterium]
MEAEAVRERDPDVLFLSWCGTAERRMTVAEVARRPGWAEISAVRARRVHLLPESLFGRPGPGLAEGLRLLYECVYGDAAAAAQAAARRAGLAEGALDWPDGPPQEGSPQPEARGARGQRS